METIKNTILEIVHEHPEGLNRAQIAAYLRQAGYTYCGQKLMADMDDALYALITQPSARHNRRCHCHEQKHCAV